VAFLEYNARKEIKMHKRTKFEIGKYCLVLSAASFAGGLVPAIIWERTGVYAIIMAALLMAFFFAIGAYFLEEGESDE
jgi:MFS-type transporter involved in bile tolerance (Atg22 family)